MNLYFIAAAVILCATCLVHSVMGERLVFRRLRERGDDEGRIPRPHLAILAATWHALSVLGLALAVILWRLSTVAEASPAQTFIEHTIAIATALCALLVLVYTRGRHPGWLALCAAAMLVGLG